MVLTHTSIAGHFIAGITDAFETAFIIDALGVVIAVKPLALVDICKTNKELTVTYHYSEGFVGLKVRFSK